MSRLSLYLLGVPRIECDGQPIRLDRRKALALLAYLAVTDESHRRDSLVDLLWPEVDATRGRAALRRTLYALRQALTGDWLDVDREEIGLQPSPDRASGTGQVLWVDVDQFRRHLAECETHGHPPSQVCPACLAPLTEAVALVRGDFLSGFGLKDSFNFDDWQLFQAEVLRREVVEALERLVHWHSTQREFEPALAYARHRLALDPLDESAHRQLMRLYTWSGRRSAALRQYEECVSVLHDQLGVPPQEATTQLHKAIQAGRAPRAPEETSEPETPLRPELLPDLPAEPPSFLKEEVVAERPLFVARERELAGLDAHLNAALSGQGQVVFVTGEAGSGKTALVQEFSRRALEADASLNAASGNCNAHTGLGDPYLPFREILALLTGDVQARWMAGAMTAEHARRLWHSVPHAAKMLIEAGPDLVDTFLPGTTLLKRATAVVPGQPDWLTDLDQLVKRRPVSPGALRPQQSDLFEQYTRVLKALAQRGPLLLVVDDLQWADLGSISLLFHLGRQLAGSRILIIGAYRAEEVAIGRGGERHPLEPVVHQFQRDFGDITVNLSLADSQEFVDAFLDSEPNRLGVAFRDMLFRQTRGHPLFTIELLRGMQDRGDLVQDIGGRWAEGPALDWETLPARVEAAIAERIGRLAEPLKDLLRAASVEGEVFTAEVVARVRTVGEREVVRRLSGELDRQHRLVRVHAIERLEARRVSHYRFRNYLFQKYLYDNLDQVERAYLHEDVGHALEELYADQASELAPVAVQLARHFQEAGIAEKAILYLHQAGDRAVQLSAYQEGIAHLTRGLSLLMTLPESLERAERELALQLSLGMAWMGTSVAEVERAFVRARELCQQTGKTSQLCRILGQLSSMHYVQTNYQRARELGEEALELAKQAGDPLLVAQNHWRLGFVCFGLGEYTAAQAHLEQVFAFYAPQHHHALVLLGGADAGPSALAYDACCLWCLGFPDQASRRSQEALARARELGHPFTLADVLTFGGCMFHGMRRDAQRLKDSSEELLQLASEAGMPTWLAHATWRHGESIAMLGQIREGMAQLQEGIARGRAMDERIYMPTALGSLAEVQAKAGHLEEALAAMAEALALVEETDERHGEAELNRVRAELLLMQGNEADAESSLQKAVEVARRQQAKSWELRATTSLARLWQKQGKHAQARQVLAEIYDWFTEGFDTRDLQEAKALLEELV